MIYYTQTANAEQVTRDLSSDDDHLIAYTGGQPLDGDMVVVLECPHGFAVVTDLPSEQSTAVFEAADAAYTYAANRFADDVELGADDWAVVPYASDSGGNTVFQETVQRRYEIAWNDD